jgi:hypothetical protein
VTEQSCKANALPEGLTRVHSDCDDGARGLAPSRGTVIEGKGVTRRPAEPIRNCHSALTLTTDTTSLETPKWFLLTFR